MSLCYRIEGDQLVECDTEEIGRAHYLMIHPDEIKKCNEFPESWRYAKKLGAHYIIPSVIGPPDDAMLAALMDVI